MSLGFLVFEDGTCFAGQMPVAQDVWGEVVFNTSHGGYEEILTDPSYYRQIVVLTAPMQGNYGSQPENWESNCYQAQGLVCLELQKSMRDSQVLKQCQEQGRAILTEVDTRAITLKIREAGAPWGALVAADTPEQAQQKMKELLQQREVLPKDWVYQVSRKQIEMLPGFHPQGPKVGILDFGVKNNIVREVQKRSSQVVVFPARTQSLVLEAHQLQALVLSNGPGNPEDVEAVVENLRGWLGRWPIFAICMGHQLLARALGAQTFRLKFGHRGGNHPIQDLLLNQIYMAAHNHGYAVDPDTLPEGVRPIMYNLNDRTLAGFQDVNRRFLSVQFHPEGAPGPAEPNVLFDYFFKQVVS